MHAARRRRGALLQVKWAHFVQGLDADPRERTPMHYVATARMMAEVVGSVHPEDFGDASIKDALLAGLPASGTKPFDAGGECWTGFTVTPAHRALALRVQGRAQARCLSCALLTSGGRGTRVAQGSPPIPEGSDGLAKAVGAMAEYVQASREQMEKEKKCDHLSFTLQASRIFRRLCGGIPRRAQERVQEVGLGTDSFPPEALPTEEAMVRFERLSKAGDVGARAGSARPPARGAGRGG